MLTRPASGDVGPHGQMSEGGSSLAHDKLSVLSTSRRGSNEEEKLRRTKEKAKVIGAGRVRRAKRVT